MASLRFAALIDFSHKGESIGGGGSRHCPSRDLPKKGKERNMARPKKDANLTRCRHITVRISDVDYDIIERNAKGAGMTVAAYIRDQAVHREVKISYPVVVELEEVQKLTELFLNIANNLNQIARFFNTGGIQSISMREAIYDCIADIKGMRKAVLNHVS
ncbi:plasmid mobilization protein [Pseudobutyrivibrio sp.]